MRKKIIFSCCLLVIVSSVFFIWKRTTEKHFEKSKIEGETIVYSKFGNKLTKHIVKDGTELILIRKGEKLTLYLPYELSMKTHWLVEPNEQILVESSDLFVAKNLISHKKDGGSPLMQKLVIKIPDFSGILRIYSEQFDNKKLEIYIKLK